MLNYTSEQLASARAAKSANELLEMAKKNGVNLTMGQAESFLRLSSGKLSEEELENVAGGGCGSGEPGPEPGGEPIEVKWERMANAFFNVPVYVPFPCPYCKASSNGRYSVYAHYKDDYHNEYRFCRCFACDKENMHITDGHLS